MVPRQFGDGTILPSCNRALAWCVPGAWTSRLTQSDAEVGALVCARDRCFRVDCVGLGGVDVAVSLGALLSARPARRTFEDERGEIRSGLPEHTLLAGFEAAVADLRSFATAYSLDWSSSGATVVAALRPRSFDVDDHIACAIAAAPAVIRSRPLRQCTPFTCACCSRHCGFRRTGEQGLWSIGSAPSYALRPHVSARGSAHQDGTVARSPWVWGRGSRRVMTLGSQQVACRSQYRRMQGSASH